MFNIILAYLRNRHHLDMAQMAAALQIPLPEYIKIEAGQLLPDEGQLTTMEAFFKEDHPYIGQSLLVSLDMRLTKLENELLLEINHALRLQITKKQQLQES